MALPIRFDRDHARELVRCLESGEPFAHSGVGWTKVELLTLAGVVHFTVLSQGPILHDGVSFHALSGERQEAIERQLLDDIDAAIRCCSMLTMELADGTFDQRFHSRVRGSAQRREGHDDYSLTRDSVV